MKGRKRALKKEEPMDQTETKPLMNWTEEEDRLLIEKATENNCKNWNAVAVFIEGRTAIQCSARFKRIQPGIIKGAWTEKEDKQLLELCKQYGKNWSLISRTMVTRTGKQIRDRFLNALDKNLIKDKFTPEEDEKIIKFYKVYGTSWCKIAKKIKGRTGDMVKNRFYSSLKKVIQEGKGKRLLGKKTKRRRKPASEEKAIKKPKKATPTPVYAPLLIQAIPPSGVIEHNEVITAGASENTEANEKESNAQGNKVQFNCEVVKEDFKRLDKTESVSQQIKEPFQWFGRNSSKFLKMPSSFDRSNTNQNIQNEDNDNYYISEKKIRKPIPMLHYRNDFGSEINFIERRFGMGEPYAQSYLLPSRTEQLRSLIVDYVSNGGNGNKKDNLASQLAILKEIKADTQEKLLSLNLANKS